MYKVNDIVKVLGDKNCKQILFIESIIGVNIYYMHDNTSYAEHQITNEINIQDKINMLKNLSEKIYNDMMDAENIKKISNSLLGLQDYYIKKYKNFK